VGVCEHPSEGKQWWRPDGSTLEVSPYGSFGAKAYHGQTREFAIRVTNLADEEISYHWAFDPSASYAGGYHPRDKNGKQMKDLWAVAAEIDESIEKVTIRFGVSSGKWQTQVTCNSEGGSSTGRGGYAFAFSRPYLQDNHTYVVVSDNMIEVPHRVVAIDKDGKIHEAVDRDTGSAGNIRQSTFGFKGLPIQNIQEFQFQTRHYQWVTFKNVSLQPDMKTNVQVGIEGEVTVPQKTLNSLPNIFVMGPSHSTFGIFDKVVSLTQNWVWNKTGRQHSAKAYDEIFNSTHNRTANDVLVMVFSLDREERIPAGYEDLLPRPWAEIQADLKQGRNVELFGKIRGLNVILIATPDMAQLEKAIAASKFLNDPKSFLKTEGKGCDVGIEDFKINFDPDNMLYYAVASIRNYGKVTSPAFLVSFCRDVTGHVKPTIHGAGPIEPGKVWSERSSSFGLKEGVNEISVVLDPANMVEESEESNNRAVLRVVIRDGQIVEK
jgi:hypothetical protein